MHSYGTKVLVVEDSRSINSLLCNSITTKLRIDVVSASTMEQALEILNQQAEQFFVAILDLNLADAPDGEVVDQVLAFDLPSIILTGSMSDNLHKEMMEKPIIDYVVKRNINEIEYVIDMVGRLRDNQTCKALVVDDTKAARAELTALLERHYFQVLSAEDGIEALKILEKNPDIQLVISDYNMPNMDGIELISRIRAKHSRNEMAIIGVSASREEETTVRFLKSGANDFLTRPFLHEEFYCRVSQNIDAIRGFARLRDAADRDSLTGLYNRSQLINIGEKLFENARRDSLRLMAVVIEIDQLRAVIKDHGRSAGEKAVQHVAAIFERQLRSSDIISRLSDSEFCLLCVNADAGEDSQQLLKNIRDVVQYTPLQLTDTVSVPLTINIGYCTEPNDTVEQMIEHADLALQRARDQGHNQICWYDTFAGSQSAAG